MNYELAARLAILHCDELLHAAAVRRLLVRPRVRRRSARARAAASVRAVGHAALTLGDALAETP
ncbi:MAG: hypothetical protein GIW94_06650 [Candidatus Eremiobacteraeota bacterium]|nr:hypothetical protein [Candidatus Eremiobacteraeota bacterium]MBC5822761.1 hypothetical protein [Candidatus Eremiobacteraeota bacterium]